VSVIAHSQGRRGEPWHFKGDFYEGVKSAQGVGLQKVR
jgi:hypothetical protein